MNPTTSKITIAQKIKSKQSAHSIKNGSPKLRDLLRQVKYIMHSSRGYVLIFVLKCIEMQDSNERVPLQFI